MITAPINHICVDERGVAYIAGTRIKVRHVAVERQARGASVEQIQEAYPHLSLAQIYAALAYYYDHQEQVDTEIAEATRSAEEMRDQNPNPLTREQLEAAMAERESEKAKATAEPLAYELPADLLAAYHRLVSKKFAEGLTVEEEAELERLGADLDAADAATPLERNADAGARREHDRRISVLTDIIAKLKSLQEPV